MKIVATVLTACLAVACVAAAPRSAAAMPNDPDHPAVVGKFYRQSNQPAVMYQYAASLWCHVQNPSQMKAFGGFAQVRVVPVLKMVGRQTGTCGWPNGFYRRSNEPAVYRLSGRGLVPNVGPEICHVINEQQMAAFGGFRLVVVVEPNSEVGRGRRSVTPCRNP